MPWLKEQSGPNLIKVATAVAPAAAMVVAALLAWIVVDPEIWLAAAVIGAVALLAAQLVAGRR